MMVKMIIMYGAWEYDDDDDDDDDGDDDDHVWCVGV